MTLSRGTLEMILFVEDDPKSFQDFTEIEIGGKNLSSSTVSKRLKELVAIKVFKESEVRSKTGRRVTGYKLTERGERVLGMLKKLEEELKSNGLE